MKLPNFIEKYRYTTGMYIIANLFPLAGVLFLDWKVFLLISLYYLETVIAGFMVVVKIATLRFYLKKTMKINIGSFFALGMFVLVLGLLLLAIFGGSEQFENPHTVPLYWLWGHRDLWLGVTGLFIYQQLS